jgi:hypothetical protein
MFNQKNKKIIEQLRQEQATTHSIELSFVDAAVRSDEVQVEEVIQKVSALRPENLIYARVAKLLKGDKT